MPDTTHDEIRDLIAKGWTPPAEALEPYRHLLRPFYGAKGWKSQPSAKLDNDDAKNIAALIAVFDHFGIEIPEPFRCVVCQKSECEGHIMPKEAAARFG